MNHNIEMPPKKRALVKRKGTEKKFVISTPDGIQRLYQRSIEPAVRVERRSEKIKRVKKK